MEQLTAKQISELKSALAAYGYDIKRFPKPRKRKGQPFIPYQWGQVSEIYEGPCCPPSRNAKWLEPNGEWKVVQHSPGASEIQEYFARVKAGNISHCRALVPMGGEHGHA